MDNTLDTLLQVRLDSFDAVTAAAG